jgi:hypothetical protein|nr:MAG TPA: holin [Ackermannviridae sp.]
MKKIKIIWYFLLAWLAIITSNAHAIEITENSISHVMLKTQTGIDLLFNAIGGFIGGLVYIAMILTDQSKKIVLTRIQIIGNIFISTVGGILMFLLTESNTWMKINDNIFQLAVVVLFGASSVEGWNVLKRRFLRTISGENDSNKETSNRE